MDRCRCTADSGVCVRDSAAGALTAVVVQLHLCDGRLEATARPLPADTALRMPALCSSIMTATSPLSRRSSLHAPLLFSLLCLLLLLSFSPLVAARNHGHGQHGHAKSPKEKDAILNASNVYTGATARSLSLRPWSSLPAWFDWCDVDGVSYCTASWNQHIPKGQHSSPPHPHTPPLQPSPASRTASPSTAPQPPSLLLSSPAQYELRMTADSHDDDSTAGSCEEGESHHVGSL